MSKTSMTLTKTCMSCGQQKPLSAFLQLSESQAATYGNICSSCRKTLHENIAKPPQDTEGSTTSTSKETIDSKTKTKAEADKRKLRKEVAENYFKDREEKSEQSQEIVENRKLKAQLERNHREGKNRLFLKEGRKQSFPTFLDKTKPSVSLDKTKPSVSIASSQKEKTENRPTQATSKTDLTTNRLIPPGTEPAKPSIPSEKEKTKPSVSIDSSQREKVENRPTQATNKMDLTNRLIPPRTEQAYSQSLINNAFIRSLGRSAKLAQAVEKMAKQQKEADAGKTNEPTEPEEMRKLNDFVRKNFPGK